MQIVCPDTHSHSPGYSDSPGISHVPRALAVLIALLCLGGCNTDQNAPTAAPASNTNRPDAPDTRIANSPLPPPARPESPFLNTAPHAHYTGSQSCRSCHSEIASAFDVTPHARALAKAPPELQNASLTDSVSGYVFQSRTDQQRLIHSDELPLTQHPQRDFEIAWTVGSGHFGHSFLSLAQGFLVQSPLTWYSTRQCWDLSPGYSGPDHYAFHRSISARCLSCHAGSLQIRNRNEYLVDVHEQAISCERCHGPGELHVARHEQTATDSSRTNAAPIDHSIVNPAHLPRQLAESVCEQCHLQGDVQIFVRGQRFDDFRPGLPLASFRQEFRARVQGEMTVVGHVEQMHASPCYQKSTSLSCVTCHHPHQIRARPEQSTVWRNACLSCHQSAACTEQQSSRDAKADRCTDCHMPKSPTELPHVAFTHHRIGLHPGLSQSSQSSQAADTSTRGADPAVTASPSSVRLVELNTSADLLSAADLSRNRGLALLQLSLKSALPESLRDARDLLQEAWNAGARDAAVAAGLARIAAEIGWNEKALEWADIALQLDADPTEDRTTALRIRGEMDFNAGRYAQALARFEELTRTRREARHWFYRGMTEQNLDQTDAAIRSLQMSLEIDPRNPGAHTALAAILESRSNPAAEQHRKAAFRLLQANPSGAVRW
ncbi:MAG: tetratricopeptide repeat protein [Planctomycetota bacterium]